MMTSTRRWWVLGVAVVLGTVAAACAEDAQVSTVRSEQGDGATAPGTSIDDTAPGTSVTDTVAPTEPPRTTVQMTLPTIPTTPPEESYPDDTSYDDEGPVVSVPADLLPLGDPSASAFTWEDSYSTGDSVDAYLAALVEIPVGEYEDREGQCYAVVGSFTATSVSEGLVVSSFHAPPLYGAVNDTAAETGFGSCDTSGLEAAGFGWTYDIETTVGTSYLFYEPFFVEGAGATLDAVVVGDVYFGEDLMFFAPTLSSSLPSVPTQVGASIAEGQTLLPVGDPTQSTFTYASEYAPDDQWSGTVGGLVELPLSSYAEVSGRCFALVGTLVPTAIAEGDVSSPYTTPDFEVIGDGHQLTDGYMNCDDSSLEPAGYGYYLDAEVALNTPFAFWISYFVPSTAEPRLEAIVVGQSTTDDHVLFSPTVLPSIPPVG